MGRMSHSECSARQMSESIFPNRRARKMLHFLFQGKE